jgi:serine protease Do
MYLYNKNRLIALLVCVLFLGFGYGFYYMHAQHKRLYSELAASIQNFKSEGVPAQGAVPVVDPLSRMCSPWLEIQKNTSDAVVQVFTQVARFNWLEPYKSPELGEGAGSGFFIDERGYFLTNYHVVDEASNIQIQIPSFGKERFDSEIIGVSPERDIALLKVSDEAYKTITKQSGKFNTLSLGKSDSILRTQELLALGYPLGMQTLKSTQGIVSGREQPFIQITNPLNPGISGGPVLDFSGRVVGIAAAGIPGAQNVGYIIPIDEVKAAINDLYKVTLLRKPTLGVVFASSTKDLDAYLGNPGRGGWYVASVFKNSLFEKIGIKEGDVVYEVNGYQVDQFGEISVPWSEDKISMLALFNRMVVGDEIRLMLYRKGARKDFRFKLELSSEMPVRYMYPQFESIDYEIIGGMVVMDLALNHVPYLLKSAPFLMKYTKPEYQEDSELVIASIFPNSEAYKTRGIISPGALIQEVNGIKVRTLAQFRNALLESKKTGYITLSLANPIVDKVFAALSLEKVLAGEAELSHRHFYTQSALVKELKTQEASDDKKNAS